MALSKLLISEPPLQILPQLAVKVGLNEALVLQQLHYWLQQRATETFDGQVWVKNTYERWRKYHFPFWSARTIQRIFNSLEEQGVVISVQREAYERQKLYRIDYAVMDKLASCNMPDWHDPSCQIGTMAEDDAEQDCPLDEESMQQKRPMAKTPSVKKIFKDKIKEDVVTNVTTANDINVVADVGPKVSKARLKKVENPKPIGLSDEDKIKHKALIIAIAKVTHSDLKIHGGRVGQVARTLRLGGYTASDVMEAFELWKQFDFRWRQTRQVPTPEQLLQAMSRLKKNEQEPEVKVTYEDLFDDGIDPNQTLDDVLKGA